MPLEWRLQVLEARVKSEVEIPVVVRAANLTELEPDAQSAVMDALGIGGDFPVVLVGDVGVSVGDLDVGAVIAAVKSAAG
jgi:hypothetical protein